MEMRILPNNSDLANFDYQEIVPGQVYLAPGRVLIIQQPEETALLVLIDE